MKSANEKPPRKAVKKAATQTAEPDEGIAVSPAEAELLSQLSVAQADYERSNPDPWDWPAGPLYQHDAKLKLKQLGAQFAAGDRHALFSALQQCARHDLAMPRWLSGGFLTGYRRVLNCDTGSWDEAFGTPYAPGMHLAAKKRDRQLRLKVREMIDAIRKTEKNAKGRPVAIDNDLFDRVGEMLGQKRDVISRLHSETRALAWQVKPSKAVKQHGK